MYLKQSTPEDTTWVGKHMNIQFRLRNLPHTKPQLNRWADTVIDQSLIVKSYSATRFGDV